MPDPILKIAAEEIKVILARHDIAGAVVLCSRTHNEFLLRVDPTWSIAWIEGNRLRIRTKPGEFPSVAAQHEAVNATVGMIAGLGQGCHDVEQQVRLILQTLSEFMQIQVKHTREDGPVVAPDPVVREETRAHLAEHDAAAKPPAAPPDDGQMQGGSAP